MALSLPEGQSDPLRTEPPWVLPAAPSPVPSGPLGLLGSAQWGLRPRVIVRVQYWGAVAVPQGEWHFPTYLFPASVTGQGWVGVPERFLCSPPFVLVLNKEMLRQGASTHESALCLWHQGSHPLGSPGEPPETPCPAGTWPWGTSVGSQAIQDKEKSLGCVGCADADTLPLSDLLSPHLLLAANFCSDQGL